MRKLVQIPGFSHLVQHLTLSALVEVSNHSGGDQKRGRLSFTNKKFFSCVEFDFESCTRLPRKEQGFFVLIETREKRTDAIQSFN